MPGSERKIHQTGIPLLGGLAIFLSLFFVFYLVRGQLLAGELGIHHWVGFFIGAVFLMLGGFLDDKYSLPPRWQVVFPLLASLAVIAGGVNMEKITSPFGGYLYLDSLKIPVWAWAGAVH
jgi:UDP-GlcNAc:undecaprenyl-phosphate GlcNAc-1-phosphate transferase